ncbi:MAG: type II secretion system protein [Chloroflexi bacterium]|nr:MAG: type II secretion system protein [Chloroflexota bacterium]
MTRRARRQGGYTLVETIVAITIGAIVMAAIFPVFFLLYRVEVTWGDSTQARASGLLAEESLLRDLRVYRVQQADHNSLVLISPAGPNQTYSVTYSVDSSRLMRTVSGSSATVVAHGIKEFTAYPCSLGVVRVAIVTLGTSGTAVPLEPRLSIAPRNQGCS